MALINHFILTAICLIATVAIFAGCDNKRDANAGSSQQQLLKGVNIDSMAQVVDTMTPAANYRKISAKEAKEMRDANTAAVLLDVRTEAEFRERRVAGAVLIPVGDLNVRTASAAIPDKDALILVYCRRGIRSKIAANMLLSMGYTNVYDFGGIGEWRYETERNF
ncbi:MAG: rhodanese-like domain-containing protein [Chitinispirillales bacterium]|jgi:rhodanese-related sulfurtransferase|nr:rhodanese-like domain-containing protein [Chitinispirillales bacterium]